MSDHNITTRRCVICGIGTIKPTAQPGRICPYEGHMAELPEDFELPTCDYCYEAFIDMDTAKRLDIALKKVISGE